MVITPWGTVGRQGEAGNGSAPDGPSLPAHMRRERLFAAMVASCAERGYEATSVADLLDVSGVSRATFYELFDNKADCFRATIEVLLSGGLAAIRETYRTDLPWEQRARQALGNFLDLTAAQPAAARLCLVESFAAGSAGTQSVESAVRKLGDFGRHALEQMPGREGMPEDLSQAIIGGFHTVLYRRLDEDRADELPGLAERLWQWAMAYSPPPEPLRLRTRRPKLEGESVPPFATVDPGERMIRAFATAVMEKGYGQTTISDVAGIASISQRTLYEHFNSKAELLEAALDSAGAQLAAAVLPAIRRSPGWPDSVRAGFGATCSFLAAEPAFAYLREVEVYAAGPKAMAMRNGTGNQILTEMLSDSEVPEFDPLYFEAIEGAAYSVLHERVRNEGPSSLPEAAPLLTYVSLAPILGAERACEVANGDGRKRPAS